MMYIPPFYIKKLPDEYLRSIVRREVYTFRRGTLITIAGSSFRKTGTGKSWTALKIGEYNDADYLEGAKKVVYFISDFLKVMEDVESHPRPYGQVIVIDEAGSLVSADKWQSVVNKAVSYTVQTFRYLRCCVVLVMPQRRLIDKHIRTMADYHIIMDVRTEGAGRRIFLSTPYALFYDEWNDKDLRFTLKAYFKPYNKVIRLINVPITPLQSEKLIQEYEEISQKYKKKLRDLLYGEIVNYEKDLSREMTDAELNEFIEKLVEDNEFLSSVVIDRKIDKEILRINLEKIYPDFTFSEKTVGIIYKILKKRLGV